MNNFAFCEQIGSEPHNAGKSVDDMLLVPELKVSLDRYPHGKHLVLHILKARTISIRSTIPAVSRAISRECMGVD